MKSKKNPYIQGGNGDSCMGMKREKKRGGTEMKHS